MSVNFSIFTKYSF